MLTDELLKKSTEDEKKYLDMLNLAAAKYAYKFTEDDPASIYFIMLSKTFNDMKEQMASQIKGDNYVCLADFTMQESRMLQNYRKTCSTALQRASKDAVDNFLKKTEEARSKYLSELKDTVYEVKNQVFSVTERVHQRSQLLVIALAASTLVNVVAAGFLAFFFLR